MAQLAHLGADLLLPDNSGTDQNGIDELHFYALNRAELTLATCRLLGIRSQPAAAAHAA